MLLMSVTEPHAADDLQKEKRKEKKEKGTVCSPSEARPPVRQILHAQAQEQLRIPLAWFVSTITFVLISGHLPEERGGGAGFQFCG